MRKWAGQLPGEPEMRSARSPMYTDTAAMRMITKCQHTRYVAIGFKPHRATVATVATVAPICRGAGDRGHIRAPVGL